MFALMINRCAAEREFVIEVVLNFITFGSDDMFRYTLVCGAPGKPWLSHGSESVRPTSNRVDTLNALLDDRVCEGLCLLGSNWKCASIVRYGDCVEIQRGENALVIDSTVGVSTLAALCKAQHPQLWMGWYREVGVDIVFAHTSRKAILAATGCCGCLFDEKLQLWLVETGKSALYQLGTHKVRVTGGEEETSSAGS